MTERTFFMVWNPNGRTPAHKHDSYTLASNEADRLSRIAPGQTFYVLQALTASRRVEVQTTTLQGSESIVREIEIPF
jgi:hypothetical protein